MADGAEQSLGGDGSVLKKFQHPDYTECGSRRASVSLEKLDTLWVNTGTVCNIECANCYIQSSPKNDRLSFLSLSDLLPFLDEAEVFGAREIGFTGGEPFANPHMVQMLHAVLERGFTVLVLTNAMRPMQRPIIFDALAALPASFKRNVRFRVSLDHFDAALHDEERGKGSFKETLRGLQMLHKQEFALSIAARLRWGQCADQMRAGFAGLIDEYGLDISPEHDLVLFPEMDEEATVPEITTDCWKILDKEPRDLMCATARMVVKRKGARSPVVTACTLLAYQEEFELGGSLAEAEKSVKLNHPHCAQFCVLGGASCSG